MFSHYFSLAGTCSIVAPPMSMKLNKQGSNTLCQDCFFCFSTFQFFFVFVEIFLQDKFVVKKFHSFLYCLKLPHQLSKTLKTCWLPFWNTFLNFAWCNNFALEQLCFYLGATIRLKNLKKLISLLYSLEKP